MTDAGAYNKAIGGGKKAPVKGKDTKKSKVSSILAGASSATAKPILDSSAPEGDNWFEKPVIKQVLDTISTGLYSVGNYANFATQTDEDASKQLVDSAKSGDKFATAINFLGQNGGLGGAVGGGLMKGLSAGIGGNRNDVKTMDNMVQNTRKHLGYEALPEGDAAKLGQAGVGFVLNAALDPLSWVGIGEGAALARGATRGFAKAKGELAVEAKTGVSDGLTEPTRWKEAKRQGAIEVNKYRDSKFAVQQGKEAKYAIKKAGNTDAVKATYLMENIQTLHPAVKAKILKDMNDPMESLAKFLDDPAMVPKVEKLIEDLGPATENAAEGIAPVVNAADDIPTEAISPDAVVKPAPVPAAPKITLPEVGLASIKPPTKAEQAADILGRFRSESSKAVYGDDVIQKVIKFVDDKMAAGIPLTKIKNSELVAQGLKYEHVPLFKGGTDLPDIKDVSSVGDMKSIIKDIEGGGITGAALAPLYEVMGTLDPKELGGLLKTLTKSEEFKNAAKAIGEYGTKRTGETPLTYLGVSGHGKVSQPGPGFTAMDNLSAKTAANPDHARKYLESRYVATTTHLAGLKNAPVYRQIADKLFRDTIDVQRVPAGPRTAKGGASVTAKDAASQGAKYERRYGTHSSIYRIQEVTNVLRNMMKQKVIKTKSEYDDAYMAILTDIDDRLRLAGFDPHLDNMMLMGDKLVVRLGPSDVLRQLSKSDRIKYIHGNMNYEKFMGKKTSINEYLPSTILDMAETMVRSATQLTPQGKIDVTALVNNALHTLNGSFDKIAKGPRAIKSNLDYNSAIKDNIEILKVIDAQADNVTDYASMFVKANTLADKGSVVRLAMQTHPEVFKEASMKRLDIVTNELIAKFTKGMADYKPSIVSQLVNTNMRNASIYGGSVAKQIGEASAKYSEDVLNALDNGTMGDFLSELVKKPPFPAIDSIATKIVGENRKAVQASVAAADEIRQAESLNRNVAASANGAKANAKTAAKVNGEAHIQNPELAAELAKPKADINMPKVFDLGVRESNRNMLIRSFGTQRIFNKGSGMPITFQQLESSSHASSLLLTSFQAVLRDFRARGFSPEDMRVAFKSVQEGTPTEGLGAELNQLMTTMFDPNKTNFLSRNSIGPDHFNALLEKGGMDAFKVDPAIGIQDMNSVWRTWNVTHVEDLLSRLMHVMTRASEDVSMGASFSKHFGFSEYAPGLVKIEDKAGKNPFFPLIDQSLYYTKEVAGEFVHIGRLIQESRSFKPNTGLHTFVTKVMDPIISSLKMTQTTLKPGHHVMSVTGDMWRNNLALNTIGFVNPARQAKLYAESANVLRSSVGEIAELSAIGRFEHVQGITTNLGLAGHSVTSTGKAGFEVFPNIKGGGRIDHHDLYSIMQSTGVALPPHLGGQTEDFLTDFATGIPSSNKVINGIDKVTAGLDRVFNPLKPKFGMKNPYSLNKFTAHRDTWTRGALFLGAMRSRHFKSVEEATTFASAFVKKWAPLASDLGATEAKYFRRGIFYYTWIRGMVPRIIEAALTNPGVATAPNKLMYSIALNNGLDLNSIGDPFPEGTMFPDWYSERVIGPQYSQDGDLWGANPTGPLGDVMNSLGSNVKPKDFLSTDAFTKTAGTFLNMSTPFFKAPIELITGSTIDRSIPIPDRAQYVQDMIGPARFISKATGKDLYPALGPNGQIGFPNRTEKKYSSGMTTDEMLKNALPEALNFGTGANVTNYTSDSATANVKFQKSAERTAKKKSDQRFGQ